MTTIDWPKIAGTIRPNVRLDSKGAWWLHYRVAGTPPADYSIVLEAQNEDDAMSEASNRLMVPVEHIRRFGA